MKSGSAVWREYPEFMAAFTIRPFNRMRFGSSRLAVAVDEVCTDCDESEYVERLEAADDQRSWVRVCPASGPRTRIFGTLGSVSAGENSSCRSSKMVVGVSGCIGALCLMDTAEWYDSFKLDACRLEVRPDISESVMLECDTEAGAAKVYCEGLGVPRSGRTCVHPSRNRSHSSQHAWIVDPSNSSSGALPSRLLWRMLNNISANDQHA